MPKADRFLKLRAVLRNTHNLYVHARTLTNTASDVGVCEEFWIGATGTGDKQRGKAMLCILYSHDLMEDSPSNGMKGYELPAQASIDRFVISDYEVELSLV